MVIKNTLQKNIRTLKKQAVEHVMPLGISIPDYHKKGALILVKGKGITVTDIDERSYMDIVAGGNFHLAVGYGRKEIAKVMYEQACQFQSYSPVVAPLPTIKLAKKLAEITPGTLSAVFYANSGSDAVEAALRLARHYHCFNGQPQRYKVISRRHAYHGVTLGAINCTGPDSFTYMRKYAEPILDGVTHVVAPYCYRCDLGKVYPGCGVACAKEVENEIIRQDPNLVSAFIGEPVFGTAGVIPPVSEYWPIVRSICDKYGVLMIVDEILTGFGRTGKLFASEHWHIEPDIMTMGKAINSGYVPLSATIVKSEIYQKINHFSIAYTHSGHPVGCAAALANIGIIESEDLVNNSATVGAYLFDGLKTLLKYRIVGDVRGIGLMCAIEIVKNRDTKDRFLVEDRAAQRVVDRLFKHGVLSRAMGKDIIQIGPSLIFTKSNADIVVSALDKSIKEVEKELLD